MATRTAVGSKSTGAGVLLAGLIVAAVLVLAVTLLAGLGDYEVFGGIIVATALSAVTVPILRRIASRSNVPGFFTLLVVAFLLKFIVGTLARYWVAFGSLYDGNPDAAGYHEWGTRISAAFRGGTFATGLESLTATDFIRFLTGSIYTVIGPTALGGFFVLSWLAFVGLLLFENAFAVGVPQGRRLSYARLVLLLPSLVYWPSSIGKESWMLFALGLASFGASRFLSGRIRAGLIPLLLGVWFAWLLRPHMAGLLGLSLAAGFLVKRPRASLGELAPIAKAFGLLVVGVLAFVLVREATAFLQDRGIDPLADVGAAADVAGGRVAYGGSEFSPVSVFDLPFGVPMAFLTVLFRPLIIEASNVQAGVAALEGTFLLILVFVRRHWIVAALRSMRDAPYVAYAFSFTVLFALAFSTVANFGLLARQRSMALPLLALLLSIPPGSERGPATSPPGSPDAIRR